VGDQADRALYVGVDLGTTNSTAAVFDGERVTLVRNGQGSTLTPSVVRITPKGLTVGVRARKFLESDPDNTRSEFKRLMGTAQPIAFPAAKLTKRPEELAAEVLRSLRADVKEQLGFEPGRAVISVPALFELPQSSATSDAARLAGFERVELLQEPIASALAAGWTTADANGAWLVYDLGGGTFDASLLETRDGLLRVVGHDGDNFLGGRDFDWAVVDWAIAEIARSGGPALSRSDPAHAPAIRRLKLAAEEAKIELTRADGANLALPAPLEVAGLDDPIEVDLALARATLEELCLPLIERSIAVCQRLLAAHGLTPGQLERVVLVGGPTVMPLLRARVKAGLGAPFAEGLDPMTLVAQGASIYAATAGLDARPKARTEGPAGRKLWLQYPAMSSDLTPHVIGRLLDGPGPEASTVRLIRTDGLWQGSAVKLDGEKAFVTSVDLAPRRPNVFSFEAKSEDGAPVPIDPPSFTIVQGLTIGDPPLSRTIGVALASNVVRVYFERGAPLPARRSFVHQTVESVAKGSAESFLQIPIVQGEFENAHLCRLVGTLQIQGHALSASLPAGSDVELTLELDRGGRLSARALVPSLQQVFTEVAQLLVPDASPEALEANLDALRARIAALRSDAFRRGATQTVRKLAEIERGFADIERDIEAAKGGDADAAQKARRSLIELDGALEETELDKRWPELEDKARSHLAWAGGWISRYGSDREKQLFDEVVEAVDRARGSKEPRELERQLRLVDDLGTAAFHRHPEAWEWMFESAASDVSRATDLPKAELLVREGRAAMARRNTPALREVTERLWKLLPADAKTRRLGHDSGLR
jgi:molecular chaperone DnaK